MKPIDGKNLAARLRTELARDIKESGLHPKLAVLLVGEDPASHLYVKLKEKTAAEVGIETEICRLPSHVDEAEILKTIESWNADDSVHAILVQLPLPESCDTNRVIHSILPRKDADGFHPKNVELLLAGEGRIIPPLHEGILRLIGETDLSPNLTETVILANSEVFSQPLEYLLKKGGAFVQTFKPDDVDDDALLQAGIIVVAVGRPKFLKRTQVKSGACIVDVGTNKLEDDRVVGDVDSENMQDIPGWITPVPGGVGPMTIAMLLRNVFNLAKPN